MLIREVYNKIKLCMSADRIGPDMPFTHWKLHFRSTMYDFCKKRFLCFGENAEFRAGAYAVHCSNIRLGKNVVVRPSSMLFADDHASITIEDNVMMGAGVHFYVNNHKFDDRNTPIIEQGYYPSKSIIVRNGAWIGANSIILPGVIVGENSVIGAGSVVTKSVEPFTVYAGIPARKVRDIM